MLDILIMLGVVIILALAVFAILRVFPVPAEVQPMLHVALIVVFAVLLIWVLLSLGGMAPPLSLR